ncbi:cysteine hydrolase family protein [Sphingobium sp.]|uniref:cysteine hydrolase family protein n=1 Tax=Sphingobium sp. TaxID=1912891 RepID=UPI002BD6ED97|nr:isochorismatase family protein [Sphingobium sp.]HUD93656.1 isochorismatase family protein [Sphingobium sp.]
MPISQMDSRSALVVVDLQKGLAHYPTIHPIEDVAHQAGLLAKAFRDRGLPVYLVAVAGVAPGRVEQGFALEELPHDFLELLPELGRQSDDHVITKHGWGAFTGTGLDTLLRAAGVTQVVLAGILTSVGIESTARQAHELGFNVTIALDAITDIVPLAHANSLENIFPRLGETGTSRDIIERLG